MPDKWPKDYRDIFWREYPRRVAKKAAMTLLDRIHKKGDLDFNRLIEAVRLYASAVNGREMRYVLHPSTWLNGERWDDEPAAIAGKPASFLNQQHQAEIQRTRELIARKMAGRPTEAEFDAQFERLGLSHLRVKRQETLQ